MICFINDLHLCMEGFGILNSVDLIFLHRCTSLAIRTEVVKDFVLLFKCWIRMVDCDIGCCRYGSMDWFDLWICCWWFCLARVWRCRLEMWCFIASRCLLGMLRYRCIMYALYDDSSVIIMSAHVVKTGSVRSLQNVLVFELRKLWVRFWIRSTCVFNRSMIKHGQ